MTVEEAILSRSPLPQNGTYTMYDHIFALEMAVVGSVGCIRVDTKTEKVSVVSSKANIKVKEDIITVNINARTNEVLVENGLIDIRIA